MQPMRLDDMMATALVVDRLKAAHRAQRRWAEKPMKERLAVLRRLRRLLARPGAAGVDLAACVGRASRGETLTAEILPLAEALRFLEREAEGLLAPRRPGSSGRPLWLGGVDLEIRREPLGVVLVVGPSNYPIFLPGVQMVQALAAGNGVLLKPGRGGTVAARALADLLHDAGLPEGLVGILSEEPEVVRRVLDGEGSDRAQGPGVDKVVLTGSAETGRAMLAELAPRLLPSVMELSGCDAAFVRRDADLDRVVEALVCGLRLNAGATCVAPRRVFVDSTLAQALAERLDHAAWRLPRVAVAPDTARRARALIREAVQLGARCLTTMEDPGSLRAEAFPAIVLTGVPPQAAILREDLCAPVLSLIAVTGDDEALTLDQLCPYALGATVFGGETGARALAGRVRAGVVVVNDLIVPTADPRLPFGGRGWSGFGVTRGAEGLLEMTVPKAMAVRRSRRGRLRHLEPVAKEDEPLFRAFLALSHGDLPTRLHGGLALCRALLRRVFRHRDPAHGPLGRPEELPR